MHKLLSVVILGLTAAAARAAPTLDAATLLKNGEDAQALNREFRGLKEVDPCKDGETACIGKSIAKCQGTTWETSQGQCSRSQFCFALPSVSSPGTRVACTSQKSAGGLITASGATGGIFGQSSNSSSTDKGGAVERGPGRSSAPSVTGPSTIISDFTPTATSGLPSATPASSAPANAESDLSDDITSRQPSTMSRSTAISSQPTLTAVPNATPSVSTEPTALSVSSVVVFSTPPTSKAGPPRVTVTVTLVPSQETTLAPQTRTISPQDASAIIASIDAATRSTAVPSPALHSSAPTTIPVSAAADDAVPFGSTSSPIPTQGSYGGY